MSAELGRGYEEANGAGLTRHPNLSPLEGWPNLEPDLDAIQARARESLAWLKTLPGSPEKDQARALLETALPYLRYRVRNLEAYLAAARLTQAGGPDLNDGAYRLVEHTCDGCGVKLLWIGPSGGFSLPYEAGWRWAGVPDRETGDVESSKDLCPTCAARFLGSHGWKIKTWPEDQWVDKLPEPPKAERYLVPAWREPEEAHELGRGHEEANGAGMPPRGFTPPTAPARPGPATFDSGESTLTAEDVFKAAAYAVSLMYDPAAEEKPWHTGLRLNTAADINEIRTTLERWAGVAPTTESEQQP